MNLGPLDTPKMCLIVVTIQTHQNKRNLLPPANDVWGKVMFLHLSVILFTGGGVYPSMQWGRHPLGRHPPRQTPPQADTLAPGQTPPSNTTGYGQQVGGTHPTGMHTCCILFLT